LQEKRNIIFSKLWECGGDGDNNNGEADWLRMGTNVVPVQLSSVNHTSNNG